MYQLNEFEKAEIIKLFECIKNEDHIYEDKLG